MIKVIEEHHDNETVTIYRGKCGHCGSVVEFTKDECRDIEYLGMAISCPVCRLHNISIKNAEFRIVKKGCEK